MNKKIKLVVGFIFMVTFSLFFTSQISARDSYTFSNGKVDFSVSSSKGIYPLAYFYKDSSKIDTITLCNLERCPGTLTYSKFLSFNTTGNFSFVYYVFDSYEWKSLSFLVKPEDLKQKAVLSGNDAPPDNLNAGRYDDGFMKVITVKTVCKLVHVFDNKYSKCVNKYLT
jgi:hypothetical protein